MLSPDAAFALTLTGVPLLPLRFSLLQDKPPRRTTAASSTGGGGGAASAAASGASRRSLGEDEVGAAAAGSAASVGAGASGGGVGVQAEGLLSLQSPELLPHVLIEVRVGGWLVGQIVVLRGAVHTTEHRSSHSCKSPLVPDVPCLSLSSPVCLLTLLSHPNNEQR